MHDHVVCKMKEKLPKKNTEWARVKKREWVLNFEDKSIKVNAPSINVSPYFDLLTNIWYWELIPTKHKVE